MADIPIVNFSKGELAPELYARIDIAQYEAGAKTLRNFVIQPYGGLASRPGFRLIGELDSFEDDARLIPFQASSLTADAAYVIGAQDGMARLLSSGGFVLEEGLKITAITKAAEAVVTSPFHAYEVGDRVFFDGIVGMTQINDRFATVLAVLSDSQYRIDIDTTDFSTFVSSDGTLRTVEPDPPVVPDPPTPPVVPDPPPTTGGGGGTGSGLGNRFEQIP